MNVFERITYEISFKVYCYFFIGSSSIKRQCFENLNTKKQYLINVCILKL